MSKTTKSTLQRAIGAIFILALIALIAILLLQPADKGSEVVATPSSKPPVKTPTAPTGEAPVLVLESSAASGTVTIPNDGSVPTGKDIEIISESLWQSIEQEQPTTNSPIVAANDQPSITMPAVKPAEPKVPVAAQKPQEAPKKEASTASKPAIAPPKLELIAGSQQNSAKPAPTTPKTATSSTKPAAASGNWFVQVGAFGNAENAQKLVNQYKKQGYNVRIQRENNLNRVQIGPFATKKEAEQVQAKTKGGSLNPAVIHLP